ncbi:MAG: phage integrase N-terminal SAM-like domain-containing protein [Acidimicrobiia bacterium]
MRARSLNTIQQRSQRHDPVTSGLAKFHRRSPETISDREIQRYLVYLHQERGLAPVSCNRVVHGLRFFYRETLGREQQAFRLPCARQPSKLPEVLSREEVVRL